MQYIGWKGERTMKNGNERRRKKLKEDGRNTGKDTRGDSPPY